MRRIIQQHCQMGNGHKRVPRVSCGSRALLVDTGWNRPRVQPKQLQGVKRGNVVGWSSESRKRLRRVLATAYVPGVVPLSVCLSVPVAVAEWREEWSKLTNRFWTAMRREGSFIAAVWRVELQRRGMPHIHAVMWWEGSQEAGARQVDGLWRRSLAGWKISPREVVRRIEDVAEDGRIFSGVSSVLVDNQGSASVPFNAPEGVRSRTVWVESMDQTPNGVRYVCDHTSKRKQAQLGFAGRQWGVVNRRRLSFMESCEDVTERQMVLLLRVIRRYSRRWYSGRYRGRLSRLRMNTGASEVWATAHFQQQLLSWVRRNAPA